MFNLKNLDHFIHKKFSHSSGHGGQNVNKRNTKVQLEIYFTELQKHQVISAELAEKLNQKYPAGFIEVASQATRFQHNNLKIALKHLHQIIREALEEL
jgi:protein subunit release factor B